MTGIFEREPGKRWPRSQRFQLTDKGVEAEASYRAMLVENRATSNGRPSFDAARAAWATPLALEPSDGLYLGELHEAPRTIEDMVQALELCGTVRREVREAVNRLTDLGLVEPLSVKVVL